jgi:hypothetical protein
MGVPTSEVGYTSATTGRGDHEVHKGHVVTLGKKKKSMIAVDLLYHPSLSLSIQIVMITLPYHPSLTTVQ